MKSTWKKSDRVPRWNLTAGFFLFVVGLAIAGYCGYVMRYVGDTVSPIWSVAGWVMVFLGLILFIFGIVQSPIQRK